MPYSGSFLGEVKSLLFGALGFGLVGVPAELIYSEQVDSRVEFNPEVEQAARHQTIEAEVRGRD